MQTLDAFTIAYIEAALWSSIDDEDRPLDKNYDVRAIEAGTLATMIGDCQEFQAENADAIGTEYDRAGHDFWFTRNHHGAGFWDGDWPQEIGQRLTKAAHAYGSFDLYVGDDGQIHG